MRKIVETKSGNKLPDGEVPAAAYLADKLEEVEENNPQAAHLDEIVSLLDNETQTLDANVDSTGLMMSGQALNFAASLGPSERGSKTEP